MTTKVVIRGARSFLAHTPGLVRYGSKPTREIEMNPDTAGLINSNLRSYEAAASYLPNQAYLGGVEPDALEEFPRPWFSRDGEGSRRYPYGEIMPEEEFYGVMKEMDAFDLLRLESSFAQRARAALAAHPAWSDSELERLRKGATESQLQDQLAPDSGNLPLYLRDGTLIGVMNRAHDKDHSLFADVLLENLATKAAAVMAVKTLLSDLDVDPASISYIVNNGEEAVGDRYQRGGGNLAKAVGEATGCTNATGSDVKAFCCAPTHAAVIGASMITAGLFERVLVVGGCSLAKLGMKYQGHLGAGMPIIEDVLAGSAFLLERDDGVSPVLRMDTVGTHPVGAGGGQANILQELVTKPLRRAGLKFSDIDKYATEMHNPEVTEPAGSGNVPLLNYRLIASLAVRAGELTQAEMPAFVQKHGMPGFSPTQGHIASALPFVPHAVDGLAAGHMQRVMFLAKGSLFLGRMTQMSDGLSFILEANG